MTIDPENIAAEMREAAEAFQHRPQSMRDRAFVEVLTAFQTAANPANVLAVLNNRDALKERVAELERLLTYIRENEVREEPAHPADEIAAAIRACTTKEPQT